MTIPTESELARFLTVGIEAAKKAGTYSKSKWGSHLDIEYKGEINLVTEVDKNSEKMIVDTLRAAFPDHDILGEEGMSERKDSPFKWVIDPLDGTTNFAHGYPLYCVSIALECAGEILIGIVYEPLRDEMFTAVKGQGAHLNGKALRVSKAGEVLKALVSTGFAYNIRQAKDASLEHFKNVILRAQGVRRDGVAAIDLCYVAAGRYDGFWELNLFPWDMAAGLLMVTEAGGNVTRFDGTPFTIYDKEILATNGLLHDEMVAILTLK